MSHAGGQFTLRPNYEIIERYLSDQRMVDFASNYSDGFVDEDGVPFLGPLDGIGLDEFAKSL